MLYGEQFVKVGKNQSAMWANSEMEHHITFCQEGAVLEEQNIVFLDPFNDSCLTRTLGLIDYNFSEDLEK